MAKLLMLKGLPASGKSTYAKELVAQGWKRVNKDDLRSMIDDNKWSRENEKDIISSEMALCILALKQGYNVVVDDTNFGHEDRWREVATKNNAEFQIKFFDVPISECIERDSKRGSRAVGGKVIQRMYDQYLKPKPYPYINGLPDCYVFDIDGTLAHATNRSMYDYEKVGSDTLDTHVADILKSLSDKMIFIMSGREDSCREATIKWLNDNGIYYNGLFMRPAGDKRKDSIIKRELWEQNIKDKCNVLGVFDDRNQVVDLWRSLGLKCFQVGYGYF